VNVDTHQTEAIASLWTAADPCADRRPGRSATRVSGTAGRRQPRFRCSPTADGIRTIGLDTTRGHYSTTANSTTSSSCSAAARHRYGPYDTTEKRPALSRAADGARNSPAALQQHPRDWRRRAQTVRPPSAFLLQCERHQRPPGPRGWPATAANHAATWRSDRHGSVRPIPKASHEG
jgi:hypothetical protein